MKIEKSKRSPFKGMYDVNNNGESQTICIIDLRKRVANNDGGRVCGMSLKQLLPLVEEANDHHLCET